MESSKREQSDTTTTMRMKHGCDEMSADPNLSHACACDSRMKNGCEVWCSHPVGCSRLLSAVNDLTATNLKKILKVDTSEVL